MWIIYWFLCWRELSPLSQRKTKCILFWLLRLWAVHITSEFYYLLFLFIKKTDHLLHVQPRCLRRTMVAHFLIFGFLKDPKTLALAKPASSSTIDLPHQMLIFRQLNIYMGPIQIIKARERASFKLNCNILLSCYFCFIKRREEHIIVKCHKLKPKATKYSKISSEIFWPKPFLSFALFKSMELCQLAFVVVVQITENTRSWLLCYHHQWQWYPTKRRKERERWSGWKFGPPFITEIFGVVWFLLILYSW